MIFKKLNDDASFLFYLDAFSFWKIDVSKTFAPKTIHTSAKAKHPNEMTIIPPKSILTVVSERIVMFKGRLRSVLRYLIEANAMRQQTAPMP